MKTLVRIVVAANAATTPLFSYGVSPATRSDRILFSYCGEYSRGLGTATPGTVEKAAIEIPENIAGKWEGNYITQVYVGYGTSSEKEIEIFISDSLEETPVYVQKAEIKNQGGWNIVTLDTPYEITGSSFYVGYGSYINNSNDKPIGIDDNKNNEPYGSFIEIDGEWSNYAKFFGDVCIKIMIEGDSLPQNEVEIENIEVPKLIQVGTPFSVIVNIFNQGAAEVSSVTAQYTLNGVTSQIKDIIFLNGPIASRSSGTIQLADLLSKEEGRNLPLEIKLNLINGEENETDGKDSDSSLIDCAEKCYTKNVVVEEFTGTWCGWCPRGIVGMKYMEDNYGDQGFIGIAVHYGDEMYAESYAPLASKYYSSPGFPCAIANRGEEFDPSTASLMEHYSLLRSQLSPASINVSASYNEEDNSLTATAVTEYSFDQTNSPYKLAFVITENNVGPYIQENYFTNGELGQTLEGWTDKPFYVVTFYDEVARDITDVFGIEGSVPVSLVSRKPYSYTSALSLKNVADIKNCNVVALIIDSETGCIVNGAKTKIEGATGVTGLSGDNKGIIKVYNVQGMKVLETEDPALLNSLPHGIYIANGKKIMIR